MFLVIFGCYGVLNTVLNITQCVFRNQSFSGSSTIQCAVVHKNQFAVFRLLNIQLNNVYSHFNSIIYCFQRIFRKITPISTMSHYNYDRPNNDAAVIYYFHYFS